MPFLLAEILNFQCALHLKGVGSLSKIERGEVLPSLKLAFRIAEELGVCICTLFNHE